MTAFLSFTGLGIRSIGGIGDAGVPVHYEEDPETKQVKEIRDEPLPPLAVSDSVATQFDTKEMKALGWRVKYPKPLSPGVEESASPKTDN